MTADFAADTVASPAPQADSEPRADSVPQAIATAKQALARGIELAALREFNAAIAYFTRAIRLSQDILQDILVPDPARVSTRTHSRADTTDIEITATQSLYHRGCALCRLERYEGAIADFTHLIQQPPTSSAIPASWLIAKLTEIYIHRGNAYRRLAQHWQALADLNQGIARSGGSAQSYGCRGLIYLDRDDFEAAIADFDQALTLHPTFAQGYLWRGFAHLRSGAPELAIADLDRAIAAIPTCAEAFNHRGVAYFQLGNLAQAQADFSAAIRLNRGFAEAYSNRGNVRQLLGDTGAAKVDYDEAIALNPRLAELHANRAAIAPFDPITFNPMTFDPMKTAEDGVSALPANSAAAYRHRAQARAKAGQVRAAIADYTAALTTTPTAHALYHRGKLYAAVGENSKALADFDEAIARSPDYGQAYCDRAQWRFQMHNLTGTLADIDQAVSCLDQIPKETYITRCLAHFALGHQPQALADFEQLVMCFQSSSQTSKDSTSMGSSGSFSGESFGD
ncbi:MAG: tetratricopeptide repeat protein [Phormidesmis sp.]